MSPYISIIVPVYKVRDYIKETIHSIISQDYRDFELVLIDDGTPDDSAVLAESLLKESSLDYSIIHTENHGVSAARNTGLNNAKGKYVVMVDADDVLTPDFLDNYVNLIQKYPDRNIYSTSFTIIQGENVIEQPSTASPVMEYGAEEAQVAFYKRNPRFLLPTILYSKSFLDSKNIRFDECVRFSEDVQFIWRTLAVNNKPVVHSSKSGYHYILHEGSTMTASGVQKIMTGFEGIVRLDDDIHQYLTQSIKDSFVPMCFFSMLHGSAKMLSFSLFMNLYRQSNSRRYIRTLKPQITGRIKIVANLLLTIPYFGYRLMKKY